MNDGSLTALVVVAFVFALAYRRSQAAGAPAVSWRQRVVFGLTFFGCAFVGVGINALARTEAPISAKYWREALTALVAIGAAPLTVFLLLDSALRLTRRWTRPGRCA